MKWTGKVTGTDLEIPAEGMSFFLYSALSSDDKLMEEEVVITLDIIEKLRKIYKEDTTPGRVKIIPLLDELENKINSEETSENIILKITGIKEN